MGNCLSQFGSSGLSLAAVSSSIRQTKREQLTYLKSQLEARLLKVTMALDALDNNPEVEDVINKIDAAL